MSEETEAKKPIFENEGFCPACAQQVKFEAYNSWYRDHYRCTSCGSIPRERALMDTLESYFPNWRDLVIHESSPISRGGSLRLSTECKEYLSSQYFPNNQPGEMVNGVRCENLEKLTFEDESIDIHISQDVLEHVFDPAAVFKEIARTLKPGGAHIFTTPIVNKQNPSKLRARLKPDQTVEYLAEPEYHGNPVSADGSLVTVHWGYDICQYIFDACGLFTQLIIMDDISKGIRAEYIDVLFTWKSKGSLEILA